MLKYMLYLVVISLTSIDAQLVSTLCGTGPDICSEEAIKYRTYDGYCNNVKNPKWGTTYSEYGRLLPARYSSPNGSFVLTVSGDSLPNPREMSRYLFPNGSADDPDFSLLAMTYGQFVSHDLSFTYLSSPALSCCSYDLQYLSDGPTKCSNVDIPKDDPVYSTVGARCMSMPKTYTNRDLNCSMEKDLEQLNAVNSYLDLHVVYGRTNKSVQIWRAFKNGTLNTTFRHDQLWPPYTANPNFDCFSTPNAEICYKSSDPRNNQNTHLTIVHILFMREHVRMAKILKGLNPHWDDERLFQETRNILTAVYQHITYNEWLPLIMGRDNLLKHEIIYEGDRFVDDYNESVKCEAFNEFAHGAGRHFHTMIAEKLMLSPDGRSFTGYYNISDHFHDPAIIEKDNNFDDLARGLHCQHSRASDQYHDFQVVSQIFKSNFSLGLDLKSIDIQRGRDHGLASFNDIREYCGLKRAKTFDELLDSVDEDGLMKLKHVYKHVDDIELMVGGSVEAFLPNITLGKTFFCIMLKQFHVTRISDRFFYQNGRTGLTLPQLKEIHKVTIAKILCTNGKNITMVQPKGFYVISESNDLVSCESLPSIDLTLWKEDPPSPSSPSLSSVVHINIIAFVLTLLCTIFVTCF